MFKITIKANRKPCSKRLRQRKPNFPSVSGASAKSYFGTLRGTRDNSNNQKDGGNDSANIEKTKMQGNIAIF